jgi:hypothetical protein
MPSSLQKEFEYYLEHQDDFVAKYNSKVIVIKDQTVIGVYESELEAVKETTKKYPLGTFLVQSCQPGKDSVTQTFHSRVAFA